MSSPEPTRASARNGGRPGCALVTGAARGLGAAIAAGLAADGWPVCVNYSADAAGAESVVAGIEQRGGRAAAVQADVSDYGAVDAMLARVEGELGPVLVLVNNAGVRKDQPAGFLDPASWARVVEVNLSGTFHTIHRALGPMVRARFGRVVNISSVAAARPLPGQAAYSATKSGIDALTRAIAIEVARRGVTVNAVAPGLMSTGFVPEMDDDWRAAMPSKRVAAPEEVAALVRYLASEDGAYVNGAVLTIDGALSAGMAVFSPRGRPAPVAVARDNEDEEGTWR